MAKFPCDKRKRICQDAKGFRNVHFPLTVIFAARKSGIQLLIGVMFVHLDHLKYRNIWKTIQKLSLQFEHLRFWHNFVSQNPRIRPDNIFCQSDFEYRPPVHILAERDFERSLQGGERKDQCHSGFAARQKGLHNETLMLNWLVLYMEDIVKP